MKKSLLALVIAACASQSVMAATVYDKDGTSLKVGGRVQAVLPEFSTLDQRKRLA